MLWVLRATSEAKGGPIGFLTCFLLFVPLALILIKCELEKEFGQGLTRI